MVNQIFAYVIETIAYDVIAASRCWMSWPLADYFYVLLMSSIAIITLAGMLYDFYETR